MTTAPAAAPTTADVKPLEALAWHPTHDGLRHVGGLLTITDLDLTVVATTGCGLTTVVPLAPLTEDHLPCEACLLALLALADAAFPDSDDPENE